jgi:haloacetate dehalogenase
MALRAGASDPGRLPGAAPVQTADAMMFPGFASRRVETSGAGIFVRHAGGGPGVLLVHGYPQTHAMWHRVAPVLAERFTVVCPDLRGYGASSRPPADPGHAAYSKRAMALDLVEVMASLGLSRFAVVGHDRGARVAYRLALDHPGTIAALCVLDIVPTSETWSRTDMARALASFHWALLAQPEPLPERLIGADPDFFLEWLLRAWAAPGFTFAPEALEAYRRAFRDPGVIHATCEDYRAGATVDHALDVEDRRAGRRISCPVLALWGETRATGQRAGVLDTWKAWADDVAGEGLPCGHFLPEEAPAEVLARLRPFLARTLIAR